MNTQKPPLERRVVKKILEYLRKRGGFWAKTHGNPVVTRGLPDIIGCYKGRYIAFEVKRDPSGKPTPLQAFRLAEIVQAGGMARTISSVDEAKALLDRIDEVQEARLRRRKSEPPTG